jgi:hypothetical protein
MKGIRAAGPSYCATINNPAVLHAVFKCLCDINFFLTSTQGGGDGCLLFVSGRRLASTFGIDLGRKPNCIGSSIAS